MKTLRKRIKSSVFRSLYDDNVSIFKATRISSQTQYAEDTARLLESVEFYVDADNEIIVSEQEIERALNFTHSISFVAGGTVNTAYKEVSETGKRVAMLNFADAKRPGGWVLDGAPTQEENICRCTNIYEALITDACADKYYKPNNLFNTEDHLDEPYSDRMIYLPDALIFKDDTTYINLPECKVDVIVSPAPCGRVPNVERVLIHRMRGIIKAAYIHGVDTLILGAWGCGAFGQSPETVARCFAIALHSLSVLVPKVIFAIRTTEGIPEAYSSYSIFMREFLCVWELL